MSDAAALEGSLKTEIRMMAENIAHMRKSVDEMNVELRKIAVHEEKIETITEAQERAFKAITAANEGAQDAVKESEARVMGVLNSRVAESERRLTDSIIPVAAKANTAEKFMWVASGVGATLMLIWMLAGWYMADTLKEQAGLNAAIRIHLHDVDSNAQRDRAK